MNKRSYDLLYKLLLIGDSGVGKTSLLLRYVDDVFSTTFISTIGIDFKIKTITLHGKHIKLQIWDTAGQERFFTITSSYYRGAMGIMLVYDVTDKKSFDSISRWLSNIQTHASQNVEKILVANKIDNDTKRVVSTENGQAVARENSVRFVEASAKTGENVEAAFMKLTMDIYENATLNTGRTVPQNMRLEGSASQSSFFSCCSA